MRLEFLKIIYLTPRLELIIQSCDDGDAQGILGEHLALYSFEPFVKDDHSEV